MTNKTQQDWVVSQLVEKGYISRNDCLRNYISRLSAIMCVLKKEGWEFSCEYITENGGKNYYYRVVKKPQLTLFKI